ncbi:hypothetical protein SAMN04488540_12041 [Ferrimonas sediminum]|uniref:Cytochrome oxidase Cu insertion factor, SCO1/SenC/PrrC family n=1 Tax=Ferrimonas sediminum TaxID=718193 RepID=A0A1G8ZMR1_9GAMM|nr:hypothetical protein [Ferrimonas sediminum]SDK15675.1 hypothetical protein SAMN04488540_12041 [Ferrimonas sediminum]
MNSRNRKPLMLLLVVFLAPFLTALLVLQLGWYQGGATNKGQLLSGLHYRSLAQPNPVEQQWQMLYLLPSQCDAGCEDRLTAMQKVLQALGRERDRVNAVVFYHQQRPELAQVLMEKGFLLARANDAVKSALTEQTLVIVDPLGQWVMGYGAVQGQGAQILQGKHLLADMRKLLKLSRVG